MNIQCMACGELVPIGSFRSSSDGIDVECSACGKSFFVSAAGDPDVVEPATNVPTAVTTGTDEQEDHEMRCPKCETAQAQAEACGVCGLRADRFQDYVNADGEHAASPALEALWLRCEEEWEDAGRHTRFVETASTENAYAYAARRYRAMLSKRPSDDVASAQIDRLTKMAEVALLGASSGREGSARGPEPYRNVLILLIVLLLIGGVLGMYALLRTNTQASDASPVPLSTPSPAPRR